MWGRSRFAVILVAAVGVSCAAAAARADAFELQRVGIVPSRNYTPATRTARGIDMIVIHTTEGGFWGSVRTLQSRWTDASAHFVVSRDGEVTQLVSVTDVAWHAGNFRVNEHSIGIEHEGYSGRRGSITEAEYEASAHLVAYLARRWGIPLDRRHIIGHDQVPDPNDPRRRGGYAHHTDPGRYWRWGHYMRLVRAYAKDPQPPQFEHVAEATPPEPRLHATSCYGRGVRWPSLRQGQTVAGLVTWYARACGSRLYQVDFAVDGRVVSRDGERPYAFGWNTVGLANGWHTLALRAHGPGGYRVRSTIRVRVENRPFELHVSGVSSGQTVAGPVELRIGATASLRRVTLLADGAPVAAETARPFSFRWTPPAGAAPGPHTLEVRASAWDGRVAAQTISVQGATQPHPQPQPSGPSFLRWLPFGL